MGINVQPLLAVGGVSGIAIGFGAQSVSANAITGINLVCASAVYIPRFLLRWIHLGCDHVTMGHPTHPLPCFMHRTIMPCGNITLGLHLSAAADPRHLTALESLSAQIRGSICPMAPTLTQYMRYGFFEWV